MSDDRITDTRLPLNAEQIDIWLMFYRAHTDALLQATWLALLGASERAQQQRFYRADDRLRYLATRALVRTVLSRYAPLAPADWLFSTNAFGRPTIANPQAPTLNFNLSHTSGLIALAVTGDRELGIDVENLERRPVSAGIAEQFFSPMEATDLAQLPREQQQERFFEYWTFKEAYIKARGMGLSIPLDHFSFHFPQPRQVRLSTAPELGDDAGRWRFWQFRPSAEHLLALCAARLNGPAPRLVVRSVVPTVSATDFAWTLLRTEQDV